MVIMAPRSNLNAVTIARTSLLSRPIIQIEGESLMAVNETDFEVRRLLARVINETTIHRVVPALPPILQQQQQIGKPAVITKSRSLLTGVKWNSSRLAGDVGAVSAKRSCMSSICEDLPFATVTTPDSAHRDKERGCNG